MTSQQQRFAEEFNIHPERIPVLVYKARRIGWLNERVCNGDPHPENPDPADKNRNSDLWQRDADAAVGSFTRYVAQFGFTVAFTGLGPSLKWEDRWVEIPY